jgi:hypothetical protein
MNLRFKYLLAFCLSISLVACGGGGGGGGGSSPNSPNSTPGVAGQVVKGPTSGATVTLSLIAPDGSRSVVATVISSASGGFSLPTSLQAGNVYLAEASGGQYINEITDLRESLSAPLRAVFVATGVGQRLVLNVLSELAVVQIERSTAANPWSPSLVDAANAKVKSAMGIGSGYDFAFVDLTKASAGSNPGVSNADIGSSFMVGWFSGFYQDLRLKDATSSLATAFNKFFDLTIAGTDDDGTQSSMFAGLIRFVEKSPLLSANKYSLYEDYGLPRDASSSDFSGIASTGSSSDSIPSGRLRFLSDGNLPAITNTNTFFNSRGALIAYQLSDGLADLSHIGYSSVAEVYGTDEMAIGRWNRGLYYPSGVSYNPTSRRFTTSGKPLEKLTSDLPYAAAVPAYNLPTCGMAVMSLKATTAPFGRISGGPTYGFDPASKVSAYFINGKTYIGYSIFYSGQQYSSIYSSGGASAPWAGQLLDSNQEFRIADDFYGPGGDRVTMSVMLAGNGGTKAVLKLMPKYRWPGGPNGITAAFSQDGPTQTCQPTVFSKGSLTSVPTSGRYTIPDADADGAALVGVGDWEFTAAGSPKNILRASPQDIDNMSVEKSGNALAGIGVHLAPFRQREFNYDVPQSYIYAKSSENPVYPQSGVIRYRLVSSTPYMLSSKGTLVSATRIRNATLEIDAMTGPAIWNGTCKLTIDGVIAQSVTTEYYRTMGNCGFGFRDSESYFGVLTADGGQFAVVRYTNRVDHFAQADVSLLFERVP